MTTTSLTRRGVLLASALGGTAQADRPWRADVIDIPPWGRSGPGAKPQGVYAQLLRELARRSACPLQLRLVPISRSVVDVASGYSQLTMMLERADLNTQAVVLGVVTELAIVVWLPLGSPVRQLDDLIDLNVATLRGPAYHEAFEAEPRIRKQPVSGPVQQLQMLKAGRVDAAIGVQENFLFAAREIGVAPQAFGAPLRLGQRRVLAWTSRAAPADPCFPKLQQALAEMRQSRWVEGQIAAALQSP